MEKKWKVSEEINPLLRFYVGSFFVYTDTDLYFQEKDKIDKILENIFEYNEKEFLVKTIFEIRNLAPNWFNELDIMRLFRQEQVTDGCVSIIIKKESRHNEMPAIYLHVDVEKEIAGYINEDLYRSHTVGIWYDEHMKVNYSLEG